MFEEMLIFRGGDGVLQNTRHLFIGEQNAPLQGEGGDLLAVVGIQLGDNVGTERLERVDLGKIDQVDE